MPRTSDAYLWQLSFACSCGVVYIKWRPAYTLQPEKKSVIFDCLSVPNFGLQPVSQVFKELLLLVSEVSDIIFKCKKLAKQERKINVNRPTNSSSFYLTLETKHSHESAAIWKS